MFRRPIILPGAKLVKYEIPPVTLPDPSIETAPS